jgi:RimJ/RimL family protein N-acetyltransferase
LRKSDAESMAFNMNDKDIVKNLTDTVPFPYELKDAINWIKLSQRRYRMKNLKELGFVIEIDKKAVGEIGLHEIKKDHKAMMGYWLGKEYWGGGVMTRVVKAMTKHGFNKLKLKRIYAGVYSWNKASMRVLEKAGYKLEGVLKKDELKSGKYIDVYLYAKIK